MKPVQVLLLVVAVIVAAVAGYVLRLATEGDEARTVVAEATSTPQAGGGSAAPTASVAQPTATAEAAGAVSLHMVTIREEDPEYSIDAVYPQLGLPALDAEIEDVVESAAADLRDLATEHPPSEIGSAGAYQLVSSFESAYVGPDIVSVRIVVYTYTGGAHGGSTTYGFNYSLVEQRDLTLDDALSLIGLTLEDLSGEATAQLTDKLGSALFPDGALPNPDNFQTFLISEGEVTFVFQQYQVAPYAAGIQEVSFPRVDASP